MIHISSPLDDLRYAPNGEARVRAVAREFEALFTSILFRSMRNSLPESSLLPAGLDGRLYTEMLDDEYARISSRSGSLGLADLIRRQIDGNGKSPDALQGLKSLSMLRGWGAEKYLRGKSSPPVSADVMRNVRRWDGYIREAAGQYAVDPDLVAAVIAGESAGDPRATSRAGARGLMQLMDSTAAAMEIADSYDPRSNIFGGTGYLRMMLDRYRGDERRALAAYNAGPQAVDRYDGIPPYPETRKYVSRVLEYRQRFTGEPADSEE